MSPPTSDENDIVLAFDAYGTLLSTESIATKLADYVKDGQAEEVAAKWRLYQLEYTWRLNSMNKYEDFSKITERALQHAVREAGEVIAAKGVANLMSSYDSLSTFPDVKPTLKALSETPNMRCVIFSNGTHEMVSASLHHSPDLAPYAASFEKIVVVEEVKKFKPAPEVYQHLGRECRKSGEQFSKNLWLVSGNPFDVVGAIAAGMRAVWVDRSDKGWTDRLGDEPTIIVKSLEDVVEAVKGYKGN